MKNDLREKLSRGVPVVNGWLSIPSGYAAEIMSRFGWDSLTIDLQHGVQDYASMFQCLQAMARSNVTPLVRVVSNETGIIGKALDAGAWGIICPMVNTAKEAADFVSACRYAPAGKRSNGPNRAAAYGIDRPYQSFANDEVLALPMIETVEAVARIDEILAVPGVDGVYVGPTDLALTMGLEPVFDADHPALMDAYRTILDATARRGTFAAIHTMSSAYAAKMIEMGFHMVTIASDATFIAQGARATIDAMRTAAKPD